MRTVGRLNRSFYMSVALLMILFNGIAFGPSIVNPSTRNVQLPVTPLVKAHAVVSVAWLLLFLAQTTLVATARTTVHRRLGIFGGLLTLAFIVTGYYTVIAEARRGFDLSGDIARVHLHQGPIRWRWG